jgi:hypothetical protein
MAKIRTKFDKNEIRFIENYCEMDLYNSKNKVVNTCYFDFEKYDEISKYKWHSDRQGYIIRKDILTKKRITMHRQILNLLDDKNVIVDHINMNKSDNRLSNLRVADDSKNEMNKGIRSNNTSGVKGISFDKSRNKWWGEILRQDKGKIRKRFESFDDAVIFRIKNEAELFKQYSNNYNPQTKTLQLTYLSHDDNLQTYIEVDLQGNLIEFTKLEN